MTSLRSLSTTQQVGLLFVTLFGVLLLVTLVAFARSFRESTDAQLALQERLARELRAVWIGAVLFWVAWIDNVQRVMPKGEVVPVPILCTVVFGAPVSLQPDEERRAFLDRARQAVVALREVVR